MFRREFHQSRAKKNIAKNHQNRGFNDLLTYLIAIDDHTILHKDGALSSHYHYIAPDLSAYTNQGLDFHAQTWSDSFHFLGNGWMVETNVLSRSFQHYDQQREFPEIVSALIDDERRLQYQHGDYFKTDFYLSITWKPEHLLASKLRYFVLDYHEDKSTDQFSRNGFEENVKTFKKTLKHYLGFLKRSLLSLTPLSGDALTTYLYQCLSGSKQSLCMPYVGAFMDCYLASDDFIGGFYPSIGDQNIKVLALDDLPPESMPCLLDTLSYFPLNYRWSSRFIPLDVSTSKQYLKRYERRWSSKAIGALGVIRESLGMPAKRDEDAQNMANMLKEAQVKNQSGHLGYGFYNSNLILMHEDRAKLQVQSEALIQHIQQMNFKVREEGVNAVEAYLGSLPGHGDYNLRKMLVDTDYIGHALPTSSVYQGELVAPCQKEGYKNKPPLLFTATQGSRPFMLNLHVEDVGHTAILGPTGKGKSTLNAMIMMSHRKYPGSRIVVLDKDRSNWLPIKALGGDYYDLSQQDCQLGVMSRISPDRLDAIDKSIEWLSECCQIQRVDMTPSRQTLLREAVERLANEEQCYKNLNHLSIQDPVMREALSVFNKGQFEYLLNGTEVLAFKSDVLGFEMSNLVKSDSKERDLCVPVIRAVLNELDNLFNDHRPTLLILEEAWLYLRHRLFREHLTDWFKTLRKKNVSVIFISQDLDDIVKSEAASTIQTACMTRIYLPNASAMEPAVKAQYEAFGLNEQQIRILQQARPKQDYYYHSEKGSRLFRLDLESLANAFLCITEKKDMEYFQKIYNKGDPKWILDWLTYLNLPQWVSFVKKHYLYDGYNISNRVKTTSVKNTVTEVHHE